MSRPAPAHSPDTRTQLRQHPERAATDEASAILAEGIVAHVGFVDDGRPFVVPMTYHFDPADPARLHLHGAHQSRLLSHLASGASVCVEVTLLDGLVYSRTALHHSVNYRSVMVFARAGPEPPLAERRTLLEAMIARVYGGRTAGVDYASVPDAHLHATAFVTLAIEAWSAKVRRGGARGPLDDAPDAPGTAGVIALRER
jgi:nitroimidazol reductase NimA-like FMN-containing flavoprotein (pyridoxamine 5'-phosphate oxidase superfamily)